jgi:3-oxoacyl-[acyl-carrier protein] reductase
MTSMNDRPVALVTGGGTGIGKSTVIKLAKRGYRVAINFSKSRDDANNTLSEIVSEGGEGLIIQGNVGNSDDVRSMIDTVVSAWGRIDVLVCNAGTTHFVNYPELDLLTDDVWNDIIQVNVLGTFYCVKACMPFLIQSKGSIVLVTSVAGITGLGSSIPYSVSKGALNTLTKSLAKTFGPSVRVNAVAPGPVLTRWLEGHEERVSDYLKQTPLGKACSADDVADTIVYLAIETNLTTGQILVVDGGRTM